MLDLQSQHNQFLVTDEDFREFNKYGLPVAVFCPNKCKTVAFGLLQKWNVEHAIVNGKKFDRNKVVFLIK
ncbi:hypothetical protein ACM26V_01400 [Salipaludibacillus sp. HK11]|uniref:hypothetical protein n=1 Tax=Salipaludibacillus sp. HK11 TaxID=3394320 RepID=UPI0039FBEE82